MKVGEYPSCVAKTGAGLVKVAKADEQVTRHTTLMNNKTPFKWGFVV